jgi:phosphoenolpyruvate-protein kinase (PTS system EI component)
MNMQLRLLPFVMGIVMAFGFSSFAQSTAGGRTNSTAQAQEQSSNLPVTANSIDNAANEISELRKAVQTLNSRLREINERALAAAANPTERDRITTSLDILTRAEQRAEIMRKALVEALEKETALKSRLLQIEEDMRPDSIDRTMALSGSTRTAEVREVRRRVLENEKRGYESLLNQCVQSRQKLEDDVRTADALVARLRQRILPWIEREIERVNPVQ